VAAVVPMTTVSLNRITITWEMDDNGVLLTDYEVEGGPLSLVMQLGLLRLAEDSAIRLSMGET
jgi:hypothetical protein